MSGCLLSNIVLVVCLYFCCAEKSSYKRPTIRQIEEIHSYEAISRSIQNVFLNGTMKDNAYTRLAYFVDRFGPRPSGSEELENSLNFLADLMRQDRFENVHTEEAKVSHWVRGEESAVLVTPRFKEMEIAAIGGSISTPDKGIAAHAIVVRSFEELKNRSKEIPGKIVVYNQPFKKYADSVKYRNEGMSAASKYGAMAVLVRSSTGKSLYSVHTGWQLKPSDGIDDIPAACITVEDAEMMDRMQKRGDTIFINIVIKTKRLPSAMSKNVIGEIRGHKYPEQIVLITAHVDSWDISEGAMDDGSGIYVTLEAVLGIISLNLRPKRTIRVVLYTGEETGMTGARRYYHDHKEESSLMTIAMELDEGIYLPQGFGFQGSKTAAIIMKEVMKLLRPLNSTTLKEQDVDYGDTKYFIKDGVPGGVLLTKDDEYFNIHHTKADTMSAINTHHMDLAAAAWATVTFVLADLEEMLPR